MPHHHPDEGGICFTSETHNTNTASHEHNTDKSRNSKESCPAENVYLLNTYSEIKFSDLETLNDTIPGFINFCLASHLLTDQLLSPFKKITTNKDYHILYRSVFLYQSNTLRAPPYLYS